MKKQSRNVAISFELLIDGKPMEVLAKPFIAANHEQRFRVSYNGSPAHVFGYDPLIRKVIVFDSASAIIHPRIEDAIGEALMVAVAA